MFQNKKFHKKECQNKLLPCVVFECNVAKVCRVAEAHLPVEAVDAGGQLDRLVTECASTGDHSPVEFSYKND